jgi:hypothetical protein
MVLHFMRRGSNHLLLRLSASLLVLVAAPACKKMMQLLEPAKPPPAVAEAPKYPALPIPLALRVPADREACLCSANFATHATALMTTNTWKQLAAGLPAPAMVPVEDFCLSAGPGTAEALALLQPLLEIWQAFSLRQSIGTLIIGQQAAWKDVEALDAIILALERFEVPPIMIGLKGPEAHAWLKQTTAPLLEQAWFIDAPASMITTTHGEQMALTKTDATQLLSSEVRNAWLEKTSATMPGLDPVMRDKLARALEVLAGKTFTIAIGKDRDSAWIGIAHEPDHLRLAEGPHDSLLAKPQLAFTNAHATKPLLGLSFWTRDMAKAWHGRSAPLSFLPALLSGWEAVPVIQAVTQKLMPDALALAGASLELKSRDFADAASIAWWQDGLHVETQGGIAGTELQRLAKPTRHAALVEGDSVVFALAGHGREDAAWWQLWQNTAALAHTTALTLADSGMLGSKEQLSWPKLLTDTVPGAQEAWSSGDTLAHKALSTDGALVLDAGGRMPALPGLPPGGDLVPLPRFCLVRDVKNRPLISTAWTGIEAGLDRIMKSIPASVPLMLPPTEMIREKTFTSHFYPSFFKSDDLMLSATLDEQTLLLGTSRLQQQSLARQLNSKPPSKGAWMRFDFTRLRAVLLPILEIRSKSTSDPALNQFLRWTEPLGDLRVHSWAQDGTARTTLDWRMQDLPAR